MDDEWDLEEGNIVAYRDGIRQPALRIVNYDYYSDNPTARSRIELNKAAYEALGTPDYVQVMISNKDGLYRLKLVPCSMDAKSARRLRTGTKGRTRMGGAPNLLRKYQMPKGYYLYEDGVFTWRTS